jgi:hypothetical protein
MDVGGYVKMKPRSNNAVLLLALVVVFSGLAAVVLLANGNHNLNRILTALGVPPVKPHVTAGTFEPVPVEAPKPPVPIIYIPERLMDHPVLPPQDAFRRTITRNRDAICAALQKAGWVGQEWQSGNPGVHGWSCGAEKDIADASDPTLMAGSLFVSARGTVPDRVSSVRLKLNFLNGETSGPVLEQAVIAAGDILSAIGWGDDPEILEKLHQLTEFNIKGTGNRISLSKELSDLPRYNFLIVSDPPGIGETGRSSFDDGR